MVCCQFQQIVSQFFQEHSRTVSRWPLPFLLAPLIFTASLTVTLVLNQDALQEKVREDRLAMFLPENVAATRNMMTLKDIFPPSDPLRDTYDVFGAAFAYVIVEDSSESANVLQNRVLRIASDIHMRITQLKVQYSWLQAEWQDLCYKKNAACLIHPIVVLMNGTDPMSSVSFFLRYPTLNIGNESIDNTLMFGSVVVNDQGLIQKSGALRLPYILDESDQQFERKALNYLWQKSFVELLQSMRYPGVQIYYTTSVSWAEEIDKNGKMTIPYLPVLFGVLFIFSVCSCCTSDWVYSKPVLGVCGILNALMAVIATLGTLVAVGYPFLQMVLIMPFLIISVSVDNMFLMLSAWRTTSVWLSVEERMAKSIGESAVSIMITALTDGLSFSVGSISYFPAVRIFCTYCALAVLYVYLFQMTFFVACLALTGRREHANRHCMTLRKAIPKDLARHRSWLYRAFCTGGQKGHDPMMPSKTHTPFVTKFLSTTYADALNLWSVKAVVVLLYIGYIGIAVYGVVSLPLGLQLEKLVPSSSYAGKEILASSRHFTAYGTYAYALFSGDVAYHRQDVTQRLIELYETLIKTDYTTDGDFWVKDFYIYTHGESFSSYPTFLNRLQTFLQQPQARHFVNDIKFELVEADNGVSIPLITYSKMLVRMRNVGHENHTAIATKLRAIFAYSGFPGFIYEPSFLLVDQQESTLHNVVQNVAIAVLVMIIIAVLFIPKILTSLWIGISIVSINLGVVGGYAFWGTRLDIVSMITIVMSIGFSVDFVAHVTYHFLISRGAHRLNRALKFVGTPILQAAASTVLGVASLSFIDSYMLRTFVKTVILVVSLGLLHGLLFLPVILSVFVPADQYLEGLGSYKEKVSNYLVNQMPRYLTQIRNKRMRSYFEPASNSSRTIGAVDNSTDSSGVQYTVEDMTTTVPIQTTASMCRPRSSSQPVLHKSTAQTVAALYDFLRLKTNEQYDMAADRDERDAGIYSEINDPMKRMAVHGAMLDRQLVHRQSARYMDQSEGTTSSSEAPLFRQSRRKSRRCSAPEHINRLLPLYTGIPAMNGPPPTGFHNSLLRRYAGPGPSSAMGASVCSSSNPQFLLRVQPTRQSNRMYVPNNHRSSRRESHISDRFPMSRPHNRLPIETVPIVLGPNGRRCTSMEQVSSGSSDSDMFAALRRSRSGVIGGMGMYGTSTFKGSPHNDSSDESDDIGLMF